MRATGLGHGVGANLLAWVLVMAVLALLPWWFVPLLLSVCAAVIHRRDRALQQMDTVVVNNKLYDDSDGSDDDPVEDPDDVDDDDPVEDLDDNDVDDPVEDVSDGDIVASSVIGPVPVAAVSPLQFTRVT
jgi:hypothetical protein